MVSCLSLLFFLPIFVLPRPVRLTLTRAIYTDLLLNRWLCLTLENSLIKKNLTVQLASLDHNWWIEDKVRVSMIVWAKIDTTVNRHEKVSENATRGLPSKCGFFGSSCLEIAEVLYRISPDNFSICNFLFRWAEPIFFCYEKSGFNLEVCFVGKRKTLFDLKKSLRDASMPLGKFASRSRGSNRERSEFDLICSGDTRKKWDEGTYLVDLITTGLISSVLFLVSQFLDIPPM